MDKNCSSLFAGINENDGSEHAYVLDLVVCEVSDLPAGGDHHLHDSVCHSTGR